MDFENALEELEAIVRKLQEGSTTLEESIELFEGGILLSKKCFDRLKNSKQKIEKIKGEMDELLSESLSL